MLRYKVLLIRVSGVRVCVCVCVCVYMCAYVGTQCGVEVSECSEFVWKVCNALPTGNTGLYGIAVHLVIVVVLLTKQCVKAIPNPAHFSL